MTIPRRMALCALTLIVWESARGQRIEVPLNTVVIRFTDTTGAVIRNANVSLSAHNKDATGVLRSDADGVVTLQLKQGDYEVTSWLPGFDTLTKDIHVVKEENPARTFVMQVGGWEGGIDVSTVPPMELLPSPMVTQLIEEEQISPSRPIPAGQAPGMQVKLVSEKAGEKVYAVIFAKGDELLSGLTDFAIKYKVEAAHFTGIGAISGATLGWLDLSQKAYQPIHVDEQVEVLSLIGDVATFNGKPVVHAHMVMGRRDGSTVGGHLWEARVNPTLEVFVSVDPVGLKKKLDDASGMKLIDPKQ